MPARKGGGRKTGGPQKHADVSDAAEQLAALQLQLEEERKARAQAEQRAKQAEKDAALAADPSVYQGAVGIDLGTTYSCVGVWENDRVEVLANDQGNRTTPSYVAFSGAERLIGDAAKNQAAMNPANTVFDAKRLIGRGMSDASVQSDMKHWPFAVVGEEGTGKPLIQVEYKGESKRFTPQEISAMVLVKMKETAERYLGKEVKKSVVTVPAYFNDAQRHATKDAGAISGMQVLRVLNEPTAAAIAYGLDGTDAKTAKQGAAKAQTVLIFDLGGGTFDVTLLAMEAGVFEVKATAGDTHLGGEDLDTKLLEYCASDFFRKNKKDLRENQRALRRLRTACERAKRALSSATTTSIEIDALYEGLDFFLTITRAKFEELCADIFKSCLKPVEQVLADSKCDKKMVDEVVLVGGSTRIPKVQQLVSDLFGGKVLNKSINPDEAVAYGAAVQAFVLSGGKSAQTDSVLLLDVTPLTCGIETEGGHMSSVIKRNTAIPTCKSKMFTTSHDYQTDVDLDIYEGERPMSRDCHLLGHFCLNGIPRAKQGEPEIEVTFNIDANGIMNVQAEDKQTGKKNHIKITNDEGRLSQEEIDRMLADAEKYAAEDRALSQCAEAREELENLCFQMQSDIDDAPRVRKSDKEKVRTACDEMLEWLNDNDDASRVELDARRRDFEAFTRPLMP